MMIYAVTGSTGALGSLVIKSLLDLKVSPQSLVALARSQDKAASLVQQGVSVRGADYEQPASLEKALQNVDRLLLVSGSAVGRRAAQHENVIRAAQKAGVKMLVYTSLSHADTSANPLAPEHKATEEILKSSGIPYVILRNNWYTENYSNDLSLARTTGTIEAAAGAGKVASAMRRDYAEAAARVLTGQGHAGKTYELAGAPWDYATLAKVASEVLGSPVVYKAVSADQRKESLLKAGLPDGVAQFVVSLDQAIAEGTLDHPSSDLENLLGRRPHDLKFGLKSLLG